MKNKRFSVLELLLLPVFAAVFLMAAKYHLVPVRIAIRSVTVAMLMVRAALSVPWWVWGAFQIPSVILLVVLAMVVLHRRKALR